MLTLYKVRLLDSYLYKIVLIFLRESSLGIALLIKRLSRLIRLVIIILIRTSRSNKR